ncbi:MAG: SUMO ligase siz1 [Trizodia sp. TS-e1964]|nr:MAG: SUMO ligase siz1 [Trizodia sp. TS-e1964]
MSTPAPFNTASCFAKLKLLYNKQLSTILRSEGLQLSGTKPILQQRIITRRSPLSLPNRYKLIRHVFAIPDINDIIARRDHGAFERVKKSIEDANKPTPPVTPRAGLPNTPITHPRPMGVNGGARVLPTHSVANTAQMLNFKKSPFYTIEQALTRVEECPPMTAHRHSVKSDVKLTQALVDRIKADRSLRVMVYCASDYVLAAYSQSDIVFPVQSELHINGEDMKANLRGLKNKPGTTRPVDITSLLKKAENARNEVKLTYALTQKAVNLVKSHSAEELSQKVAQGKKITKESVISEMTRKAEDTDIVATSTVMSLKCPLSTMRMKLQEQAPTWTCPICVKPINFDILAVDCYVSEILNLTTESTEQVSIEPNGVWSTNSGSNNNNTLVSNTEDEDVDGDADFIEIKAPRLSLLKNDPTLLAKVTSTPSSVSREPSRLAQFAQTTRKRPSDQVIDLTFSDDDDPPRPAKRTQTAFSYQNGSAAMTPIAVRPIPGFETQSSSARRNFNR